MIKCRSKLILCSSADNGGSTCLLLTDVVCSVKTNLPAVTSSDEWNSKCKAEIERDDLGNHVVVVK
jgi:hypothetical protein